MSIYDHPEQLQRACSRTVPYAQRPATNRRTLEDLAELFGTSTIPDWARSCSFHQLRQTPGFSYDRWAIDVNLPSPGVRAPCSTPETNAENPENSPDSSPLSRAAYPCYRDSYSETPIPTYHAVNSANNSSNPLDFSYNIKDQGKMKELTEDFDIVHLQTPPMVTSHAQAVSSASGAHSGVSDDLAPEPNIDLVNDFELNVIHGAARAGCLHETISNALDLPLGATPPGKGLRADHIENVLKPKLLKLTSAEKHKESVKEQEYVQSALQEEKPAAMNAGMKHFKETYTPTKKSSAYDTTPSTASASIDKYADFFAKWPATQPRDKPVNKIRRARFTHLPSRVDARFVASLLYGGKIESIRVISSKTGPSFAEILFVDPIACEQFCNDAANGLVYGKDTKGKELFALVYPGSEVDPVSGRMQAIVDNGGSRVLCAIGSDHDLDIKKSLAPYPTCARLNMEQVIETVTDKGHRKVEFRLCNILDAVALKNVLEHDEDWEGFNIRFYRDPCERQKHEPYWQG